MLAPPPLWQATLLCSHRHSLSRPSPEQPQDTEGPGSPYNLAALPSQAQSAHLDGMIKLLQ